MSTELNENSNLSSEVPATSEVPVSSEVPATSEVPVTTDNQDQSVDVRFGEDDDTNEDTNDNTNETPKDDLSKYSRVDHLYEDTPIKGQEICLFSFLSPEGIMNCNIRSVKFRGAFATMAEAEKKARELEKEDKYFKIFIGDSGKWLEFDPPSSRVDREMSSDKNHQKILDEQRKQRMNKINAMAGKHKEMIDKKEKGKGEKIDETKKAGAANDALDKQRTKRQEEKEEKEEKQRKLYANPREVALAKSRDRMRKRLEASHNKKALENIDNDSDIKPGRVQEPEKVEKIERDEKVGNAGKDNLDEKIKIVNKVSGDHENKKIKLEEADRNIEGIKRLLANRQKA
jgi:hypothetical protein